MREKMVETLLMKGIAGVGGVASFGGDSGFTRIASGDNRMVEQK
jgi:hypothetical protein